MPLLVLNRSRPLTQGEVARLPPGSASVSGFGEQVARADVTMPVHELLAFAVRLARSIPDAEFVVMEGGQKLAVAAPDASSGAVRRSAPPAPAPAPAAPASPDASPGATSPGGDLPAGDPWKMLDAGQREQAEAAFGTGYALDAAGRDRIRELYNSTDPEEVALACRIARLTSWKSFVSSLKRMLQHADVRVRCEAATALGALAGPSLVPTLRPLLQDASPEVQEAAKAAIGRIEGGGKSGS